MKILKLPFIFLGLLWFNILNLLSFLFFSLGKYRWETALAAVAGGLALLWLLLPTPQLATPPELGLNTNQQGLKVEYFTWDQVTITNKLAEQQIKLETQDFASQNDYLNLAVLAHAAGEYGLAAEYLQSAKQLDPNRAFFVD